MRCNFRGQTLDTRIVELALRYRGTGPMLSGQTIATSMMWLFQDDVVCELLDPGLCHLVEQEDMSSC